MFMSTTTIQFVGLILWTVGAAGIDGILPVINADDEIEPHVSIIAFEKDAGTLDGQWQVLQSQDNYTIIQLRGETIHFSHVTDPKTELALPDLFHLTNFCPLLGDIKDEYLQLDDPLHMASHVLIDRGTVYPSNCGEAKTVRVDFKSDGLEIIGTLGASVKTIKLNAGAPVYIGNIRTCFLTSGDPNCGQADSIDFHAYFRLVDGGRFCHGQPPPPKKAAPQSNSPRPNQSNLLTHFDPLKICTGGIECSNSAYP
jgi:hypothetical protein